MHQVVVYLKKTGSPLVYKNTFQLEETSHRYRVIRLWEEAPAPFLNRPGLLPLAVLTQSQNPTARLREIALALDTIEDRSAKANLTTASVVFGGLLIKPELIKTILRSEIMKESAIYQEILQEGEQQGLLKGKLEVAQKLLEIELPISEVISIKELSVEDLINISLPRQRLGDEPG